jgi:predicted ArsR family transcriptional regulator
LRLEAIGKHELRAALAFVRSCPEPPTADDLAAELGLSRSVARWRLERLVESGHLTPRFAERSGGPGAGRPAKTYAVVPETEALEFPRRRYEALFRLLIDALPGKRLDEVGFAFGCELARAARFRPARRTRTAVERLCRALGALGFQASLESATQREAVLVTPTCPLRPLVVEAPAARELDQGMWRGLVTSSLEGVETVRCETHDCLTPDGPCRVLVRFSE